MSAFKKFDCVFSDDEESADWASVQCETLAFGQFKGQTYASVVYNKRGRDYLRYLLTWSDLRPSSRSKIECALEAYADAKKRRR